MTKAEEIKKIGRSLAGQSCLDFIMSMTEATRAEVFSLFHIRIAWATSNILTPWPSPNYFGFKQGNDTGVKITDDFEEF